MALVIDMVQVMSSFLSLVIGIVCIVSWREARGRMLLFVGVGFFVFASSYMLYLIPYSPEIGVSIILVRTLAFIIILYAIYRNLGEARSQIALLSEKNLQLADEIARRKQAYDAHLESEEKYRLVAEYNYDWEFWVDPAGKFIYNSPSCERVTGYSAGEFSEDPTLMTKIIFDDDREVYEIHIADTISGPVDTEQLDFRIVRKDGGIRWINHYCQPVYGRTGTYLGRRGSNRDITERKLAEDALRNSQAGTNAIIRGSPIPQFVIDKNHTVIHWNDALQEISGIRTEDVLGTRLQWKAFYPEERPTMADLLVDGQIEKIASWYTGKYTPSRLVEGAYEATDFFPALGENGRWLHFTAAPVWDENGTIIGALETLEDISERRKAEEEIKRSLEEKEILLKEIHHRVKNNLQVVWGLLDLQIQATGDQDMINVLRDSQNRVRTMSLIHETLYRSSDLSHIGISHYLRNLIQTLFSTYSVSSEQISVFFDIDNVLLDVDSSIPCGLIVNELMSNTFKHAFPGGRKGEIAIGFHLADSKYVLVFADNGVGIPEGFDLSTAESLGLKLVNLLATDQLDGTIELDRRNGTKFTITFPRRQAAGAE